MLFMFRTLALIHCNQSIAFKNIIVQSKLFVDVFSTIRIRGQKRPAHINIRKEMSTQGSAANVPVDRLVVSSEDESAPPPAPVEEIQALDSSTRQYKYIYIYISYAIEKAMVALTCDCVDILRYRRTWSVLGGNYCCWSRLRWPRLQSWFTCT
jgi:hypothetical protein